MAIFADIGFLNLDMPECSGNQGIKDIILSLKWISKNIANFGGDPGNVTLLACSSGSVILHYILLSPLARGKVNSCISSNFSSKTAQTQSKFMESENFAYR